jgi:integrase
VKFRQGGPALVSLLTPSDQARQADLHNEAGHADRAAQHQPFLGCPLREGRRPKITAHDERRTCATLLVDLDVHLREVIQILRHAQIAVTMEIYVQASSRARRSAFEAVGGQPLWMACCCTRA